MNRSAPACTFLLLVSLTIFAHAAPLPGQIIVAPNDPSWLVYSGGGVAMIAAPGDPEDFLYRGSRASNGTRNGDQLSLINKLIGTGANAIYLMAVRTHGGDGNSYQNPFIDGNPSNGLDQDILNQWETWFDLMDQNGIVIYFFFYDDDARIWNTGDTVGTAETAFLRDIVNRFEHHKHLIWIVAEEYEERFSPTAVSRIAAVIRAADDHDHVIAVHKLQGTTFNEFANDPNIDQFAMQYAPSAKTPDGFHAAALQARANANGRYNVNFAEPVRGTFIENRRQKAWAVAMAGVHVMPIEMDIVSNTTAELNEIGRIRQFLESTDAHMMSPKDNLASGATNYVLAADTGAYVLYGRSVTSSLGLNALPAGEYALRWFDTLTGNTTQRSLTSGGGGVQFTKPTGFSTELALEVVRTGGGSEQVPPAVVSQSLSVSSGVTATIVLEYADPDGPGPYTFEVTEQPQNGDLSPIDSDGTVLYTPNAGFEGTDTFRWRLNDGMDDSEVATVTVIVGSQVVLLNDNFNRADSAVLGAGWVEVEESGAQVALEAGAVQFTDTSDRTLRPMAQRTFARTTDGLLEWTYTFNWRRTGTEDAYFVYMQMGDGSTMQTNAIDPGVAVNLVWGNLGAHEQLGYRRDGGHTTLRSLSGPAVIKVTVDVDAGTYAIALNGATIASDVQFANTVNAIDTVRFFTDRLNETQFSGRRFDDVEIHRLGAGSVGGTANGSPVALNSTVNVTSGVAIAVALPYADLDGPGPYTLSIARHPQNGTLIGLSAAGSVLYVPNIGFTGTDTFTWRVNDGLADSAVATITLVVSATPIVPGSPVVLLNDNFERADNAVIGAGWTELETNAARVDLVGGALEFTEASDTVMRPMVQRTFSRTANGEIEWEVEFDWSRSGPEQTYFLYMQLGDASRMQNSAIDTGIAINLVWSAVGGHESLGYRQGGNHTELTQLSGAAIVKVVVDVDARNYSVTANGETLATGIPFVGIDAIDTVRLFTHALNEAHFSSRKFSATRILRRSP